MSLYRLLAGHGAHPFHALFEIFRAKGERTHDNGFGTCLAQARNRVLTDSAIGCQNYAPSLRGNQAARFAQARLRLLIEAFAFHAHERAEKGHHADTVKEWFGGGNRGMELHHNAGFQALGVNEFQRRIGISVLGDLLKSMSEAAWLQWIPGFPIQERLNIFNAGCLLALMAVPTIYSLAEDAINNVPRAFSEASEALGATKLQTVFRVVVPSASSGILAAMLLGLGRIFGETMVVLLVAGNRLSIPDFSDGPGVVFQPAGTMTGIIAQELGEVSRGESHWQALFMVGILLFAVSLVINAAARIIVRKFAVPRI